MFKTNNLDEVLIKLLYFTGGLLFAIYLTENIYVLISYAFLSLIFVFYLFFIYKEIEINERGITIKMINRSKFVSKDKIIISKFEPNGVLSNNSYIYYDIKIEKKVIGFIKLNSKFQVNKFECFLKNHYE